MLSASFTLNVKQSFPKNLSIYTKNYSIGCDNLKSLKKYLQKLFLRMRIYPPWNFANRDFRTTNNKNGRKYLKRLSTLIIIHIFINEIIFTS